ncbi:MAG: hypothetical protein U5K71_14760 [Gracilimonas sp.]|nr:hypothetical protein [Gracilimonas sp.]
MDSILTSQVMLSAGTQTGKALLDVMPTDSEILGFTNQWYKEGLENREWISVDGEVSIPRSTLPYYLASKWEAVKNRGKNDWRLSKDMEDIITLVNNNTLNLIPSNADEKVIQYLKNSFDELLENKYAREIILSHLSGVDRSNVDGLHNDIKSFINAN